MIRMGSLSGILAINLYSAGLQWDEEVAWGVLWRKGEKEDVAPFG